MKALVITEVGESVNDLVVGDNVIISAIESCGHCTFCRKGIFAHCLGEEGASDIGWVFGHLIDGTEAKFCAGSLRPDLRAQAP